LAGTGIIYRFLRSARRRHLTNLAFEYFAVATALAAAGLIGLLILGTQVLDWYWPVLLFLAGVTGGVLHARKRYLSDYRLAQHVDRQLGLKDRVSTVVYFRENAEAASVLHAVEQQASDRLAHEDVSRAVPVGMPRYGYVGLALLAAAAGLLGVRYGVLGSLELDQPLARVDFEIFETPTNVQAASKKTAIQERFEEQLKQLGLTVDDLNQTQDNALIPNEANVSAVSEPGGEQREPGRTPQQNATPQGQDDMEASEGGEKSQGDASEAADASSEPEQGPQQKNPPPAKPKDGSSGSQDGLMDKMRNALANLMNKLKMPARSESQQASSNQPSPGEKGQQQASQKGTQSQNKSDGQGQPSPDQQSEQDGEGEKSAGQQARAGDKNSDKPGSQESKSGMGKQDGAKDLHDAQQLAAMGKISEIFGKRAEQITGEMTVEVSSGKQNLKTGYSGRNAQHIDSGAEVNRDEIPLAYQAYIQRYYEELRKSAPKTTAK
jgi:hypothetical protein